MCVCRCHSLFKRCEVDGVLVPHDMSCPDTDNAGRLLPPGYDGPTDFDFVSETAECNPAHEEDTIVRTSSQELIQRIFGADAGQKPECFHVDVLPWRTDLPAQWYKLWCDTDTGVAGMLSFSNSDCDVNNDEWEQVWQLTTNVCLEDQTLGYVAKSKCEAKPQLAAQQPQQQQQQQPACPENPPCAADAWYCPANGGCFREG